MADGRGVGEGAHRALRHDLRVVTRNVADFEFPWLKVVNPWSGDRR
jgi:hypothetical protein